MLLKYNVDLGKQLETVLLALGVPGERRNFLQEAAVPYFQKIYKFLSVIWEVNELLKQAEPLELIFITLCTLITLSAIYQAVRSFDKNKALRRFFEFIRSLPIIRTKIQEEKEKTINGILSSREPSEKLYSLPSIATPFSSLLKILKEKASKDIKVVDGKSRISGAVYLPSLAHKDFLDQVYAMFSMTNPLHAEAFPSVRQMEAEVVAMTADLLGGGPNGDSNVCGSMTSGGSDSILSAMKASRDYMAATRGITEPEMIIACSAHAAYWKAAEYFKIKLRVVPVGKDLRLSVSAVQRVLNHNTAIVVASAPGFPHGVVDHVADIARLTSRSGICLHVDACLGGFALPFLRDIGYVVPAFDFRVKGVTSISVDTHKFGMGHKGTSVVLYRSREIRQHQYTQVTDWTGGLYISPGMAGSRPGALIATAWASMVLMGREGFLEVARKIFRSARRFAEGVGSIPDLEVLGAPDMYVVAFRSRAKSNVNIYQVNEHLTAHGGWHLNALQSPAALHFCFTAMHSEELVDELLVDLRAAVATAKANPEGAKQGSAPMYGMANVTPDRGLIGEFLTVYQDAQLIP